MTLPELERAAIDEAYKGSVTNLFNVLETAVITDDEEAGISRMLKGLTIARHTRELMLHATSAGPIA